MIDPEHFWVPATTWIVMIALSAFVALRVPPNAKLTMQWGPGGKPTWTAPVWLAVAFTPVLAAIVYTVTIVATTAADSALLGTLLSVQGVLFLVIHAAHLFFAARHTAPSR